MPHPTPTTGEPADTSADPIPLTEPREGTPEVTTSRDSLTTYAEELARGSGPVAVDVERASGFRYGQDAYLVRLRRDDAGTDLIDPQALPDLSAIYQAAGEDEWGLHAADQDLHCPADVVMAPARLFDTALARLL